LSKNNKIIRRTFNGTLGSNGHPNRSEDFTMGKVEDGGSEKLGIERKE